MSTKLLVILGVALASAASLLAATQQWLQLDLVQGAATVDALALTGQDMNPTLSPIAVAGLAAALALTIAGRVFRYVLAVLIMGFGAGIIAIGAGILSDAVGSAGSKLGELTGITGSAQSDLLTGSHLTVWPVVTIVCGALLALLGLVVCIVSGRWAQGGRKYQSTTEVQADRAAASTSTATSHQRRTEPATGEASGTGASGGRDRISDWEMLSGGDDPSDDEANDFTAPPR